MEDEADNIFACVLRIHVSAYVQVVQILLCTIRAARSLTVHFLLIGYEITQIRTLVLRMPEIIPSERESCLCHVFHLWSDWSIPTYSVYQLYDTQYAGNNNIALTTVNES